MFKFRKDNVSVLAVIDKRRMKINGCYPVKIEVVCRRVQKYYPTGKDVTMEEWEKMWKGRRITEKYRSIENTFYNVRTAVEDIASKGRFSFTDLNKRLGYSTLSVNEALKSRMNFMMSQGRVNSFYRYRSTLRALERFGGTRINFEMIDVQWLERCERTWRNESKSNTTISIYMKTLRCIFNEALKAGMIREGEFPFGKTGYRIPSGKSRKMALTKEQILKIQAWKGDSGTEYWRDMWMFSYMCNGINFRDMLFLRYGDIIDGEIHFIRSKTSGRTGEPKVIRVPVLPEMYVIMKRRGNGTNGNPGDFIFRHAKNKAKPMEISLLTRNVIRQCNDALKRIAKDLEMPSFTTYAARHSFATIMKRNGVDTSFISECLGHANTEMTENYIAGYEKGERMKYASMLL